MSDKSLRINHQPVFLLTALPWRESSLRLEVFSRNYGRVVLLARSARKRQSELRGVLVPFLPISASWYGSGELKTLHRAEWLGGWALPQGRALFSGLYVNELILRLTAREDPHPKLYDALAGLMRSISDTPDDIAALRRFEWILLKELGFAPDLRQDEQGRMIDSTQIYWLGAEQGAVLLDGNDRLSERNNLGVVISGNVLIQLDNGKFDNGEDLQQALKLTRMLIDFHLPNGIKSRQVLQQMQAFQIT
ncbi:MAG: DNA repair protein RecO [Neisseria sp.]|uniref:DNA repair protein RecO n=1 Tax=Neisseria sp. TaxID=192066 RepID=UPI0026DBB061|nr:DNA repair protein RecO [Neisseria sp.]MDO4641579.1 DNA repair protein RecO [Neisseria sp.]